jgi:hypothetical protein
LMKKCNLKMTFQNIIKMIKNSLPVLMKYV